MERNMLDRIEHEKIIERIRKLEESVELLYSANLYRIEEINKLNERIDQLDTDVTTLTSETQKLIKCNSSRGTLAQSFYNKSVDAV